MAPAPRETRASFLKKAAHGGALMALSQILLSVASYIVAAVLARGLGPAQYGVYGIVYSFLLSMELIGRVGIPQSMARMVAARGSRASRLEASGFTMSCLVSVALFVVFWLAAPALAQFFNVGENGTWYFRVAALDIPVFGVFFVLNSILSGRRDFFGMTIGYVVYCLAKVVGVVYIVVSGATITNALLLNVAASILAVAYLGWRVGLPSFRFRVTFWRPIVHLALPIAIGITGTQLLGVIDLWSLNAMGQNIADEVKGYYVAATTLARMPTICAFVFSAVLVPTVSRAIGMGDAALALATMRGAFRVLLLVLLPACALIAIEAAPVMALLFSEPYAAGAGLLQILIVGHGVFNTLFFALMSSLVAINAQRTGAMIALLAVPFAILCNVLLVPPLGETGAAIAAVLPAAGASAVAMTLLARRLGPVIELLTLGKILLATLVVAVIAHLLPSDGLFVLLELTVLGFLALGLATLMGVLTLADVRPFIPAKLGAKLGLAT